MVVAPVCRMRLGQGLSLYVDLFVIADIYGNYGGFEILLLSRADKDGTK